MSEIRMDKLPKTLDELKAMPQAGLNGINQFPDWA